MRSLSDLLESDYNWWVAHAARRTTCAASPTCSSQTTTGEWHTLYGALHAQPFRPARVRLQLVSGARRTAHYMRSLSDLLESDYNWWVAHAVRGTTCAASPTCSSQTITGEWHTPHGALHAQPLRPARVRLQLVSGARRTAHYMRSISDLLESDYNWWVAHAVRGTTCAAFPTCSSQTTTGEWRTPHGALHAQPLRPARVRLQLVSGARCTGHYMRSLSDLLESDYNWWVAHAARRTTCAASLTCSSQTTTGEWHTLYAALHTQPLRPARVRLQLVSGARCTAHYMRSLSDLLESDYNWWVAHAARRTTCAASPTCSSQTTTGEWRTPHGALHAQPLRPARVRLQLVSGARRTAHYMRSLSDLLESDYNWWAAHAARRTTCAASPTCSSQTTTGEWHTPHGALHAQPLRAARVRLQLVSGARRTAHYMRSLSDLLESDYNRWVAHAARRTTCVASPTCSSQTTTGEWRTPHGALHA